MQMGAESGGDAEARAAAKALLDWWALAGADVAVADEPAPWFAPEALAAAAVPARPSPATSVPSGFASVTSLAELQRRVLAEVPGAPFADGNPAAGLMILGESPSAEDLRTGRPFSGPAGQFLDRMLAAIAIDRTGAYVALLCPRKRRPGPPGPDDIAADLALTLAHIRLAAPRLLLLLGGNPTAALTGNVLPISRVRGQWLEVDAGDGKPVPALATFNPAYLLRRPEEKARAWADLLALKHRMTA
jgi:DNA polymerase